MTTICIRLHENKFMKLWYENECLADSKCQIMTSDLCKINFSKRSYVGKLIQNLIINDEIANPNRLV